MARAVEFTRFPTSPENDSTPENREGRLVQAADLIGQLGDPLYLKKANALFHEFEEIGLNKQLGYTSPADLVECYPDFYWKRISPHLTEAVRPPERDGGGPAVDREFAQPRVLRRALPDLDGTGALMTIGGPSQSPDVWIRTDRKRVRC